MALTSDGLSVTGAGVTVNAAAGDGVDRAVLAESRLAELRERTGADVVAVTLDTDGAVVGGADGRAAAQPQHPGPGQPRRRRRGRLPGGDDAGAGRRGAAAHRRAARPARRHHHRLRHRHLRLPAARTCWPRSARCRRAGHPALVGADELVAHRAEHRRAGRSVVFTNGCFDVLHPGHVRYLEQARALGDVLMVAVNSDDSVRRLKGPDRPVNPVEDRVAVLAALSCVDHVVVFEEDSPVGADRGGPPRRLRQGRRLSAGDGAGGAAGAPARRPGAHPRVRPGPLDLGDHRPDPRPRRAATPSRPTAAPTQRGPTGRPGPRAGQP